jgi:hypothetical protein
LTLKPDGGPDLSPLLKINSLQNLYLKTDSPAQMDRLEKAGKNAGLAGARFSIDLEYSPKDGAGSKAPGR